ncbi:MAG: SusC/RagA family TonB-linked outer membrane protein [Odoribacter sp.]|nr:SusC/RagA family TonB-linked outer membrane protein [Odoribacter sp.]
MFLLLLLFTGKLFSQITVKGKVYESDGKNTVVGAAVMIKGSQDGVLTDFDGNYAITLPEGKNVLVFRCIGYFPQEIEVNGRTQINVTMEEDIKELGEVVVTALGISREEKKLGYSVSKIDDEEINKTVSHNWLNGLSGKVAGLNFDQASTGPGGSIRVTLRGEASLSHDKNTALFVVNGIPINSGMTSSNNGGGAYDNQDAPIDYGNGASDINPEDIESVTVLKGPAATALYGSRAANGAILITTKSGKETKGIGVTINSSVTLENAGFWPDFQTEYGAGNANATNAAQQRTYSFWTLGAAETDNGEAVTRTHSRYAFGPKFDGQMFYQYQGAEWEENGGAWTPVSYKRTKWEPANYYKGIFQTGVTYTNSVSIEGGNGDGNSVRLSFRDMRNNWILPNTGYTSQSLNFSFTRKINNYVQVGANVTYYRKNSDNLPMTGYSAASPLYSLLWGPNTIEIDQYKEEWASGRLKYLLREYYENGNYGTRIINRETDNIYMQLYEQTNSLDRDRVYGNARATFNILRNLSLMVRSGVDFSTDFRTQRKPKYSTNYTEGYYKEQTVRNFEMNNDFLLTWANAYADFTVQASFGGNNMVHNYSNVQLIADKLQEDGIFILQNSVNTPSYKARRTNKSVNSFYGIVSLGWRNMVFLDITGRNDWSSTLASGNNSYFYPSVSASFLMDEILDLKSNMPSLDILKVRTSWANIGNDTDPYQLLSTYANSDFSSAYKLNSRMQNYNIKPENVESYELGLEASWFRKRVGFDFTWYHSATTNQIITVPTDQITGATSQLINAGKVTNKGIEISASFVPVRTKDFKWDMNLNWFKNWNKLVSLAREVEVWQMNSATIGSRVFIYAYPGTELGRIYGQGYKRAPEGAFYYDGGKKVDVSGQVVVDAATGNPVLSGTNADELLDLCSIYPKWKGGFSQSFTYKGIKLSMTFTGQVGGRTYSVTNFALSYQGKLKNTLEGRYEGLVHPGVNMDEAGVFTPNRTITTDIVDYYNTYVWNRANVESNTFSTSFLKLKELRLEYALPKQICEKSGFLQGVSIGYYTTNVFCLTKFPQYDPEAATMNGSSISRGIETGAYPMTRTNGFNLRVSF